jgi:hypothetical protein
MFEIRVPLYDGTSREYECPLRWGEPGYRCRPPRHRRVDTLMRRERVAEPVSDPADRRDIAIYLAAVTGIAAASIATLYAMFVSGFPGFLSGFSEDPAGAVRADPTSPLLGLVGIGLVLLLVAVIVVFGAKYGPDPDREDPPSGDQHGSRDE